MSSDDREVQQHDFSSFPLQLLFLLILHLKSSQGNRERLVVCKVELRVGPLTLGKYSPSFLLSRYPLKNITMNRQRSTTQVYSPWFMERVPCRKLYIVPWAQKYSKQFYTPAILSLLSGLYRSYTFFDWTASVYFLLPVQWISSNIKMFLMFWKERILLIYLKYRTLSTFEMYSYC